MSTSCTHAQLVLTTADLARYPTAPVGLLMCCEQCGHPVRPATQQEWYVAYLTTAMGEVYPYGTIMDGRRILRAATQAEHEAAMNTPPGSQNSPRIDADPKEPGV